MCFLLCRYDATRPTAVVHAVKNGRQWPFRDEFRRISANATLKHRGAPIKLRAFLSRAEEADLAAAEAPYRESEWEIAARRVSAEDLLKVAKDLGSSKPMFCFCGPLPFAAPLQVRESCFCTSSLLLLFFPFFLFSLREVCCPEKSPKKCPNDGIMRTKQY